MNEPSVGVDYHNQVREPEQLLIAMPDILQQLQAQAEWLRKRMLITDVHVGRGGPGARRYSRSRLANDCERVRGMLDLVTDVIRLYLPGGGIPEQIHQEVWDKIYQADNVANGRNPDGTDRKKR